MEKLEIGYEQTFHEGRPYLAQPPPTCHLFVTILSNPPSRKRTSFSNDPLLTYRRKKNPLRKKAPSKDVNLVFDTFQGRKETNLTKCIYLKPQFSRAQTNTALYK